MNFRAQNRRAFLSHLGRLGVGAAAIPLFLQVFDSLDSLVLDGTAYASSPKVKPVLARYWEPIEGTDNIRCLLCPRQEILGPGKSGFCLQRVNIKGKLMTLAYGRPCILNVDPVGKNPLGHFYPEIKVLSLAHAGCNLRCLYCQNWQFSRKSPAQTRNITPFHFNDITPRIAPNRLQGISFTYTEAVCSPEFASDFASFCGDQGLVRTLCTAGYVNPGPYRDLLRHFEAVTMTFKGADDLFYRKAANGSLRPVLDSMVLTRSEGKWLELATLIVPALNDDRRSITQMARWIRKNLGMDTPWHLERFDPQYKLRHLPPTPRTTLEAARDIGMEEGLKYVYIANLAPHAGNHTYCPSCGQVTIKRFGFKLIENNLNSGRCPHCSTPLAGLWL